MKYAHYFLFLKKIYIIFLSSKQNRIGTMSTSNNFHYDATPPVGQGLLISESSTIILRHTTLDSTLLDEWSARHKDLCLTTHNTHNRQTSMPRWDSNPNLSRRAATVLRFRPRGHWDWLSNNYLKYACKVCSKFTARLVLVRLLVVNLKYCQ